MTPPKVTLTEAARNALDESLLESGCHGFLGDHAELYEAVESIVAARVAEALRDAAKDVDLWPDWADPSDAARHLNNLADEYDPTGGTPNAD